MMKIALVSVMAIVLTGCNPFAKTVREARGPHAVPQSADTADSPLCDTKHV